MDKQEARTLRINSADDSCNNDLAKVDDVIFVEQEDHETVAAFNRSAIGETLTKQQGMQKDIAEYNKPVSRNNPGTKLYPDVPAPGKMGKRSKKISRRPTEKPLSKHSANVLKNMI